MIILKVAETTGNSVKLTWTNDSPVSRYDLYRRKANNPDNTASSDPFVKIASFDISAEYLDTTDLKDINKPSPPTIKPVVKGNEVTITIKSFDYPTIYEYYLDGFDNSGASTTQSTSNIVQANIVGLKSYGYYVRRIVNDTDSDSYDNTNDTFIPTDVIDNKVANLSNGKYVIFAKAIDKALNESDLSSAVFYIDVQVEEKTTDCDVPVGVRYNHRYRGPHESKKVDFMSMQVKYNLTKLKTRVAELEVYTKNVTTKPDYTNTNIVDKIEDIEFALGDIRKEKEYEQRNN